MHSYNYEKRKVRKKCKIRKYFKKYTKILLRFLLTIKIIPKTQLADLQNDFYEIQQTKVTKAAKITK